VSTLDERARRQLGLASIRQLVAIGWTEEAIDHAVAEGRLFRVRRGVVRAAGAPVTREQAWLGAVLAAPPGTVLSEITGAVHWGFRKFATDELHLLRASPHPLRLDGVVGHRTLWLPDRDVTRYKSIPVTTPARTLIDVSGRVEVHELRRVVNDGIRRRLFTATRLLRTFQVMPRSGRRASSNMREVLAELVPGFDPRATDRELDVLAIVRAAGIPLPALQHPVRTSGRTYKLDFSYPTVLHGFEYEGFGDHGIDSWNFHNDRLRMRRLQRLGWTMWPITSETSGAEIVQMFGNAARLAGLC
jgi:hypothetical protein